MKGQSDPAITSSPSSPGARPCPHCKGTGQIIEIDPAALVNAIDDEVGYFSFTSHELIAHAAEVGGPLAEVLAGLSARKLGKLLRRIAGKSFDGLAIERIGEVRAGTVWQVAEVDYSR
ncbi:MAG: hypothetical protein WBW99_22885 [Pseudolabrys sp.]